MQRAKETLKLLSFDRAISVLSVLNLNNSLKLACKFYFLSHIWIYLE